MAGLRTVSGIVLLLGALLQTPARGQSGLELTGFGMIRPAPDVISQSMGSITTIPGRTSGWLFSMPASWYNIRATQLQVSVEAGESQLGRFGSRNRSGPQSFHFLMHANRRTSYGLGIRPVTRLDMLFTDSSGVFFLPGDTLRYVQSRSATGGISELVLGYSRRLRPSLSVGVTLNVLFGTVTQQDTISFLDQGSWTEPFPISRAERRLEFTGRTLGLSLLASVPPKSRGSLGLRVVLPIVLDLIEAQNYATARSSLNPVRHKDVGTSRMLALGYGLDLGKRQRVMAELAIAQLAEDNKNDLVFDQHLRSSLFMGAAWTLAPSGEEFILPGRLDYRMGFYRREYYLSGSRIGALSETAFSIGIGIRSVRFRHRLDLALQVGQRDSLLPDVSREDFYRVSIGITTAELWFARPKKEWD